MTARRSPGSLIGPSLGGAAIVNLSVRVTYVAANTVEPVSDSLVAKQARSSLMLVPSACRGVPDAGGRLKYATLVLSSKPATLNGNVSAGSLEAGMTLQSLLKKILSPFASVKPALVDPNGGEVLNGI